LICICTAPSQQSSGQTNIAIRISKIVLKNFISILRNLTFPLREGFLGSKLWAFKVNRFCGLFFARFPQTTEIWLQRRVMKSPKMTASQVFGV
jgi:hypothetical protein